MAFYGWVALAVLIISELALFKGIGVFREYFYLFVWWPYVFFLDAIIKARKGTSPITSNPRAFFNVSIWSVTIWLIFELINIRLQNWHYIHVTPLRSVRWLGYTLSFSTVLPGIFFTSILIKDIFFFNTSCHSKSGVKGPEIKRPSLYKWGVLGISSILLPLLWPSYFFPLVWGFAFFLLDPINLMRGQRGLIYEFMSGEPGDIYALLLGGLVCGFLWEFWNFWAGAKWVYTIPFVGRWKLFEMPILGFLGFPPFALECFSMYAFVTSMGLGSGDPLKANWSGYRARILVPLLVSIPFWLLSYWLIDQCTVMSFS